MNFLKIFHRWLWEETLYDTERRVIFFIASCLATVLPSLIIGALLNNIVFMAAPILFWVGVGVLWAAYLLVKVLYAAYLDFRRFYREEQERVFNILKD